MDLHLDCDLLCQAPKSDEHSSFLGILRSHAELRPGKENEEAKGALDLSYPVCEVSQVG